jgi:CubicO group peptidase (beta-lactamase class C family)
VQQTKCNLWIFVVALASFFQTAAAQTLSDTELRTRVEAYLEPFVSTGNFTGAILIVRKGAPVLRAAYGKASYQLDVSNTPEARFHIASISKPFTAAAILQLQEQRKLSLADPVSRFLPDFPNGNRITLDHLLTHTSGIHNVNDLPDYNDFARAPHTLAELVAKFENLPLDFEPGTSYRYSNSNYNLLALILEKASGETYGTYLRKHIFEPAALQATVHDGDASQIIPLAAAGFEPMGVSGYENAPYLDWSNKTGNGSLVSTIDDLYRFSQTILSGKILKDATIKKYLVEGHGNRYGWFIRSRNGHRAMSSNGRSPGFTSELDVFPDDNLTLIVLSNSYASVSQDPIAEGLSAILLGQPPPATPVMKAATVPESFLTSYAGEYQYGPDYFVPNGKATLKAEPGYLVLELSGFRTPLVPISETEFLERNFFGQLTISKDGNGKVTGLTYRYAGREFTAQRIEVEKK